MICASGSGKRPYDVQNDLFLLFCIGRGLVLGRFLAHTWFSFPLIFLFSGLVGIEKDIPYLFCFVPIAAFLFIFQMMRLRSRVAFTFADKQWLGVLWVGLMHRPDGWHDMETDCGNGMAEIIATAFQQKNVCL